MNVINLDAVANKGAVRNLAGKPRGEDARLAFRLDELDLSPDKVRVEVPDYIYAISSSFFLGLFSKSVLRFGNEQAFFDHYDFKTDDTIMKQIRHGLDRCLMSRSPAD